MNDIALTGIFAIVGVSIGGIFTLWATNLTQKNEQKTKDLQNIILQWETFHEIEDDLIKKIIDLDKTQKKHILKTKTRATIYNKGYENLCTPSRIKTLKKKWK